MFRLLVAGLFLKTPLVFFLNMGTCGKILFRFFKKNLLPGLGFMANAGKGTPLGKVLLHTMIS